MRKLLSIILAAVMLAGMMTVAIPASAEVVDAYPSLATQKADANATEFYIEDAADYKYFFDNRGAFSNKTVKLVADIDLNPNWTAAITATTDGDTTTYSIDKTGLEVELKIPAKVEFTGAIFDGQGHTIKGAYVEGVGGSEGSGLFGRVKGSTIKNVRFENCASVNPKSGGYAGRAGGLCTIASLNATFENIYADIKVLGSGSEGIGGFTAINLNADDTDVVYNNCVSVCEVVSLSHTSVGGFVGNAWDRSASTFNNCAFYGSVTVLGLGEASAKVGMFAGSTSAGTSAKAAQAMLNSRVTLNNCIGAGTTNANPETTGALIGYTFFGANITQANSAGKTQYINVAINNCVYTGNYTKAVGDNQDPDGALNNTFNCDAQYNLTETDTTKLTDGDKVSFDAATGYLGYQVKAVEGGYAVRFIGTGAMDDALASVGMRVTVTGENLDGIVSKDAKTSKVYSGLIVGEEGGEDDYVAAEGEFVYTINVGTFTADMGVVTVCVTTFVDAGEGDYTCSVKLLTIDTSKLAELAG